MHRNKIWKSFSNIDAGEEKQNFNAPKERAVVWGIAVAVALSVVYACGVLFALITHTVLPWLR